jgi:hypothetical protein
MQPFNARLAEIFSDKQSSPLLPDFYCDSVTFLPLIHAGLLATVATTSRHILRFQFPAP